VLPDHWMKYFFVAQVYLELQLNNDALRCYEKLRTSYFACSTYVMSQLALAYHNIRGLCLLTVCIFEHQCFSVDTVTLAYLALPSLSRASPKLERSGFHEVLPVFSIPSVFHAELRPRLRGWRSASRVHSQV